MHALHTISVMQVEEAHELVSTCQQICEFLFLQPQSSCDHKLCAVMFCLLVVWKLLQAERGVRLITSRSVYEL